MATATKKSHAGPVVTHSCCPECRLRFSPAVAAYLTVCPVCGEPTQPLATLAGAVGYGLFAPEDNLALPEAIEISIPIPIPEPWTRRPD
jgi:hypothetical protein